MLRNINITNDSITDDNDDNNNNNNNNTVDISFIIGSRNDNYGSNPILRLRFTLQNLLTFQWKDKYDMIIEVVIVEWNPVKNNLHLWEHQEIKSLLEYVCNNNNNNKNKNIINFYSVPPIYNDIINCGTNQYCPYYEYHAKNVGLRRSIGKWKLAMNIDDLFGLNLLNLIGYLISNNLIDINGIYQARRNIIYVDNISQYLDIYETIPTEELMKTWPLYEGDILSNQCFQKFPNSRFAWGAGGDFTLIHNNSLYKHFIGGYIEMCANHHLDTEFILRQILINNISSYFIQSKCGYYHINHIQQRAKRNEYKEYIHSNHTEKHIQCNQRGSGIYQYYWQYNHLANHSFWPQIYNKTNTNWGIKNVQFDKQSFS